MSGRTADGVEVREGDVVWVLDESDGGVPVTFRAGVGSYLRDMEMAGLVVYRLARDGYSTRLAALRAARDRAAAEVARLDAEIAKEVGQ